MSCRFARFGGRPGFLPAGSSGSSTAHCASVRSARPLTAKVATRSPYRWSSSSLTHLPETSSFRASDTPGPSDHIQLLSQLLKHALVPAGQGGDSHAQVLGRHWAVRRPFPLGILASLAIGILMDAFLVRTRLISSTVALHGRWNWWPSAYRRPAGDAREPAA